MSNSNTLSIEDLMSHLEEILYLRNCKNLIFSNIRKGDEVLVFVLCSHTILNYSCHS